MSFRLLPDIAIADVAFEAYGKTLPQLFQAASQATFETMVDTSQVEAKQTFDISLNAMDEEMLLFDFLNQLIFIKDQQAVVLSKFEVSIIKKPRSTYRRHMVNHVNTTNNFLLTAKVSGESINPQKHELRTDVKAVTLHLFQIKKSKKGYTATIVLDV